MIKLAIESYCQSCPHFKPIVSDKGYSYSYTSSREYVTIVCCENELACKYARDEFRKEIGG